MPLVRKPFVKVDPRTVIKGDLSSPEFPAKVRKVKGLEFFPPVTLNRKALYFVVVTDKPVYVPAVGFYNVPEKSFVTWVEGWIEVARSMSLPRGPVFHTAYVFEARKGEPPKGLFPHITKGSGGGVVPGIIY